VGVGLVGIAGKRVEDRTADDVLEGAPGQSPEEDELSEEDADVLELVGLDVGADEEDGVGVEEGLVPLRPAGIVATSEGAVADDPAPSGPSAAVVGAAVEVPRPRAAPVTAVPPSRGLLVVDTCAAKWTTTVSPGDSPRVGWTAVTRPGTAVVPRSARSSTSRPSADS
jgi:hypothetical protein